MMRLTNTCKLAALTLCIIFPLDAGAQIPDNNPDCRKDPQRGIVCSGNPPVVASIPRPISLALFNQAGSFEGIQGAVRYDREMRGTDHMAHALFAYGRVADGNDERTVLRSEILANIAAGQGRRVFGGLRHQSNAEISHPFTLITGVGLGHTSQHLSLGLESGLIRNRNTGDNGFETTVALSGYRSITGIFEVEAALRAGMGWGAGGALTGVNVGVTRRVGSFLKLRAEWNNDRLSGDGDERAARDNQLRFGLSAAVMGGRRTLRIAESLQNGQQPAPVVAQDAGIRTTGSTAFVASAEREQLLVRAQVMVDSTVAEKDVFKGPDVKGAYTFREEVECTFDAESELGGNTPKFACVDSKGGALKVKYGCNNGEVFAEVAATRLLWLLGFEADRMYPVIVKCKNCPPNLPFTTPAEQETGRFECAAIERKTGDPVESFKDQGWSIAELDKVSEQAGGAPRAHRDALRLMAVFIQHNDSKDDNQKIICAASEKKNCTRSVLVLQDVGSAFGGAGNRVREDSKADLAHWRAQMIWRDGRRCIANLAGSMKNGTILDPEISEEGRALFASLLQKVSAQQVHDIFRVAQVTTHDRGTTLADWERAFWYKAYQIVNHRCE